MLSLAGVSPLQFQGLVQHLKGGQGAEVEGPLQAGLPGDCFRPSPGRTAAEMHVDLCVPKGLGASGCKQERVGSAASPLGCTPQSQNCTVALWTGISVCLCYQETTGKGKEGSYSGCTSAVFTSVAIELG